MTDLKPCPFCASTDTRMESIADGQWMDTHVRCNHCGSRGPTSLSEVEAEKRWQFRIYECAWCGSSQITMRTNWRIDGEFYQVKCKACGRETDHYVSERQAFAEWHMDWLMDKDPVRKFYTEEDEE